MSDTLKCKLCDYESKQLFQHIKSTHNISVDEYRRMFGDSQKMQINFNPPTSVIHKNTSKGVKQSYVRIFDELNNIKELYSIKDTIELLKTNFYYKSYFGKAKNRTLKKEKPKLYNSIYHHTEILENAFSKLGRDKSNFNFVKRLIFLTEYDADISYLQCDCGKSYTWNSYCRYCPTNPNRTNFMGKNHTDSSKLKCRIAALNFLEKLNGQLVPRYNPNSIPIIEKVASEMGIDDLQHAENGGEYYVRGLGYWVDGYSKKKNVVIEYDEPHHFDSNGELKDRDIRRQREIEKYLKCKFIRINADGRVYR
jgi:hypothetical protein